MHTRNLASLIPRLGGLVFGVSQRRNMTTLETLKFDNVALRSLPNDPEKRNFVRQVKNACYSRIDLTPVDNPQMVAYSKSALALLDISEGELKKPGATTYFSGNKVLPGSEPAAHCYCGHQFGYFSGQLGDGCAAYLGEVVNSAGEKWELQLKGSGKTPFSRTADGRKVLRSSIREFLCSEALHNLGIPTTRAGTCVTSDSRIARDIFYTGNVIQERCTVVSRIAPSFIRFGSFEIFKPADDQTGRAGPSEGNKDLLWQMIDHVVESYYPQIWSVHEADKEEMVVKFVGEVARRTAGLVALWQCCGWCHGVLNTDNMSIVGVTIDYGPFGFLDRMDESFICNSSDEEGRYAYNKQPEMCKWNCIKLAEALQLAVPLEKTQAEVEKVFMPEFQRCYMETMRKKLGLVQVAEEEDEELVKLFLQTMEETGADFTNCFRLLSRVPLPGHESFDEKLEELKSALVDQCFSLHDIKQAYKARMDPTQLQMMLTMLQTNPSLARQMGKMVGAIKQEVDRREKLKKYETMTAELKTADDSSRWQHWLEKYAARLAREASGLSDVKQASAQRAQVMNTTNPRFILRNYIAQLAIDKAEQGDFSEVQKVLSLLEDPYNEDLDLSGLTLSERRASSVAGGSADDQGAGPGSCMRYDDRPPTWSLQLAVS